MKGLAERIAGRDSGSGNIVKFGVVGLPGSGEDEGLLTMKITIDSGFSVFFALQKERVEIITDRFDRTATFVGEFMDEERKQLFCDEVYFWSSPNEA